MSATTLLCKAVFPAKINTLLSYNQPGGLRAGYPNGVSSLCNEACVFTDWALHVALLLDGSNLGTLQQLWVIQLCFSFGKRRWQRALKEPRLG